MATNKNITMRQFNGTDYDTLYPKTLGSQIASTVPVSAGGTGINVNPNIHVNLGAENTSNVFEAYPRPGVYGTLPVSHGGTGQTSLAALASAMGAAKIQTGSYVGTGTYGASNPNSLTFGFRANFISITGPELKYQEFSNEVSYEICRLVYSNNYLYVLQTEHTVYSSSETYKNTASKIYNFSWSDNTFKWNNGMSGTGSTFDSITQMNHSGTTYYWVAFG